MEPTEPWHQPLLTEFERLAREAFGGGQAIAKADGSAVTQLDQAVSQLVERYLRALFPQDGFISEEAERAYLPNAERVWVLDPIDGTASYARGYPVWGLGLGLLKAQVPLEGYLDFPALGETAVCVDGRVWLNGKEFRAPSTPMISDTHNVLISSRSHKHLRLERLANFKLRNFGSSLYHLAAVGLGRAEATITGMCSLWDLVPALPFTRARGCVEVLLDGSPFVLERLLEGSPPSYALEQPLLVGEPRQVKELLANLR